MKKKLIVIGGGIAGLSAGIYGCLAGFDVELFEKNSVTGGLCTGWRRQGFYIDNCIHWLTGTDPDTELYRVWEELGALGDDTIYQDVPVFFASKIGDREVTLWHDLEKTRRELLAAAPEDATEINRFLDHVEYAKDCLIPAKKPMEEMNPYDYLVMGRSMGGMAKVMKEYGRISLRELAKRFSSPLLKQLIQDYMPKEYTAYSLLVSYATMACGNGKIPKGGSLAMALRMQERFLSLGGKLFTGRSVASIIVGNKMAVGIRLEDGTRYEADFIIPAVDFHVLYGRLLEQSYMPKQLKRAYEKPDLYPVTSGFQIAYAVNRPFSRTGTVLFDCEEFWIGSRRFDKLAFKVYDYDDIYEKNGKMVLQVNVCQGHEDFAYWSSLGREEYAAEKKRLAGEITKRLMKAFPELGDGLELLDVWSPLTYQRYCGAYHGAYMSFVTVPGVRSVQLPGRIKGIRNCYPAGQWMMSPGGLPVAATSGKFAVQRICKKEYHRVEIKETR